MNIFVGTSGYSYKEWKGNFYPKDLPDKEMLRYYGARLPSVEINNTFYRLPKKEMLIDWAEQVPDTFQFVLKASRKITHTKSLKEKESETEYLFKTVQTLGEKLGAVLFQLPPYLRANLELLANFLELVPNHVHSAFEFRHQSWYTEEVHSLLQEKNIALCHSDTNESETKGLVRTANWGYIRLRREEYKNNDLSTWAEKIRQQNWERVYVFFKHEDAGAGPALASQFLDIIAAAHK